MLWVKWVSPRRCDTIEGTDNTAHCKLKPASIYHVNKLRVYIVNRLASICLFTNLTEKERHDDQFAVVFLHRGPII